MDYAILKHDSVEALVRHVRASILEGWEPLGGIGVAADPRHAFNGLTYVQAMKREPMTDSTALIRKSDMKR